MQPHSGLYLNNCKYMNTEFLYIRIPTHVILP